MMAPDWLFTNPVPARTKGWVPKAGKKVSLKQAFMGPEMSPGMGAGQDIVRDDWRLDSPPPAAPDVASPPPPQAAGPDTLDDSGAASWAAPPVSRTGSAGQTSPIRKSDPPPTIEPVQSTVSVSGARDVGGDWTSGLSMIGDVARQAGHDDEGVQVAQSIARTEGGLFKAVGDTSGGGSYGPFQFYWQGQLANYARDKGLTLNQAAKHAQDNPDDAAAWALSGYLGDAIKEGQRKGLHGSALATYAQQRGQVSKSPERAGQWYDTMFSGADSSSKPPPSSPSGREPDMAELWKQHQGDHPGESPDDVNRTPPDGAKHTGQGDWLTAAQSQLGRSYVWGGKDLKSGFDCSGYASWVLSKMGTPPIGTSTMTMYPNTTPVSDPKPGDLVFYNMNSSDPHLQHVAVYVGNGQVIQSGGGARSVNTADVNQPVGSKP